MVEMNWGYYYVVLTFWIVVLVLDAKFGGLKLYFWIMIIVAAGTAAVLVTAVELGYKLSPILGVVPLTFVILAVVSWVLRLILKEHAKLRDPHGGR